MEYVQMLIHSSGSAYLNTAAACPVLKIPVKTSDSTDRVIQFKIKQVDQGQKGIIESNFVFTTSSAGAKFYCLEENGFKFKTFAALYQGFYYIFVYPFANTSFVVLDVVFETAPNLSQPIINGKFDGDLSTSGYAFYNNNTHFESVIYPVLHPYITRVGLTNGFSSTGQAANLLTIRTGGNSEPEMCVRVTLNELQHMTQTNGGVYGEFLLTVKYSSSTSTWTAKIETIYANSKFVVGNLNVYLIPDTKDLKLYVKPAVTFTTYEITINRGQTPNTDEYILVNDGCAWENSVNTATSIVSLF